MFLTKVAGMWAWRAALPVLRFKTSSWKRDISIVAEEVKTSKQHFLVRAYALRALECSTGVTCLVCWAQLCSALLI